MENYNYGSECDEIYKAIGRTNFIVVHGMSSVGKTTLVKHILTNYKPGIRKEIVYSYINCNTITTGLQFYHFVIDNFNNNLQKDLSLIEKTIMGVRDFVFIMDNLIKQAKRHNYKVVIVLDSIEYLQRTAALNCLSVLASIKELKLVIVTCELPSSIIENYFKSHQQASLQFRLIDIVVNCWDRKDLIEQICKIQPKRAEKLYHKFVNNVVQIFYATNTRDFVELRTFCMENFGKYLEHYEKILRNYVKEKEPELAKMSFEELDENVKLSVTYENKIVSTFLETFKSMIKERDLQAMTHLNLDRKIVLGTSLLIMAAYVAANTKPSDDKRNFVKYQKRKDRNTKKFNEDDTVVSAKQFTMERLLQIYRALCYITDGRFDDENSTPEQIPDSVLSDIKMLEDLKIITITSGDGFDTFTKYQLSRDLEREYVDRLAKQLGLNLNDFHGL